MKKRNACLSLLLCVLLLAATCLPAFAATPRVYTVEVTPPEPDAAVPMLDGVTPGIDWDGAVSAVWELLFTGTEKRSVDISQYHIPNTDQNLEYLYSFFWYTPRFLRLYPPGYSYSGGYLTALNNTGSKATDPVENRVKYDACERAVSQLLYGVKGNSDLSNWEQCLILHDRLAAWVGYAYTEYLNGTLGDDDYSAYGPLALHKGVCNGYALAYNWLLDELGFTTYYESSDILDHGWSKVELDGELYYVDVTHDDPVYDIPGRVMHTYFLVSFSTYSAGHSDGDNQVDDFDQTPSSTTYETGFYADAENKVVSEIVRINGNYYFFKADGTLCERRPDGTVEAKKSVSVFGLDDNTGRSYNLQPKLCAIGDKILYLTATDVHVYDPATGADNIVFTPARTLFPNSKFFLNGIRQLDGTVYVTATNKPSGSFTANTVENYTESFVYCNHPTTDVLSATPGANCLTPGDAQLICPACRALIDGEGQGPLGDHSYTAQTVKDAAKKADATCTEAAVYYYSCATCGAVERNDAHTFTNGTAPGHNWEWVTDTEATCNAAGVKHQACTRCDATQSQNTTIPATGNHSYTAQTVKDAAKKADATCTEAAVYYYSCATCDAVEQNDAHTFTVGTSLGHYWQWVTDTEATCNTAGVKHQKCTRCTATQSENTTIPATGNHSYTAQTVKDAAKKADATCTAAAVYYYSCATCGKVENNDSHTFTSGNAMGHDWQWVVDANATCSTAGVKHEKCSRCEATQSQNTTIPATGNHSYTKQTVSDAAKKADATCTTAATYYYSCVTCGKVEQNDSHTFTVGTSLGHDWQWVTDTEATCNTAGVKHQKCTRCTATQSENTAIPATGNHSYTAQTVKDAAKKADATCTAAAVYYYSCATCGKVEKNDAHTFTSGNAMGHDWQWVIDTNATCNAAGVKHQKCTRCDATQNENTTIPATGNHSYTKQTVSDAAKKTDATCTAAATYYYSCATCGKVEQNDSHTFTDGNAMGHDWYWVTDLEPTCGKTGSKHQACTRCTATQSENTTVPATGNHSYTKQTVSDDTLKTAATCEAAAVYYYSCATCGKVEKNDAHTFTSGAALGHDWAWVIDTDATCSTAGVKHQKCTRCTATQSEGTTIPATGSHSYTKQTVSADTLKAAATCEAAAIYYYSCASCGAIEKNDAHTFTSGAALGHDWRETARTDATCDAAGSVTYTCAHDSAHTRTESIAQKSHTDANGDGYCDNCGKDLWSGRCTYCGQVHSGFFGMIVKFFHSILAIFKR